MEIQGHNLEKIFDLFSQLKINWFLSGTSCLEHVRSGKPISYKDILNIGIYENNEKTDQIIKQLQIKKMIKYKEKVVEAILLSGYVVKIYFFINFHNYIIETRHQEGINRYRLLCYDPEVITDGVEKLLTKNGRIQVLKRRNTYCKALFGKEYLTTTLKWNEWNDPANIIWEDFIQKPIRLV